MKKIDKAWIAGIFEGEGSAGNWVRYKKKSGENYYYGRVVIYNQDLEMLEEIQRFVGGIITPRTLLMLRKSKGYQATKENYGLYINKKKDVESFILNILPYMRTTKKRKQISKLIHRNK